MKKDFFFFGLGKKCPEELRFPDNSAMGRVELISHTWYIIFGFPNPTKAELANLEDDLEVGLFKYKGLIFLPLKACNSDWYIIDNPFSYELVLQSNPEDNYLEDMENLGKDRGFSCNLIVLDTTNQNIVKLRTFAFTHAFSKELHKALNEQKQGLDKFSKVERYSLLKEAVAIFSVEDLFKKSIIKTRTGQVG